MRIFLVRHGETGWKKKGFLSYTDITLTKKGLDQAKNLAKKLKNEKIDVIYSSPLKRCVQTANYIAKELGMKVTIDKRLMEVNFGIFEGLSTEEAKRKFPEIFSKRRKNKWKFRIPRGESYEDAAKRVSRLINEIKNTYSSVVFVTHATIIKVILKQFTNKTLKEIEDKHYKPACLIVLEINPISKTQTFKK